MAGAEVMSEVGMAMMTIDLDHKRPSRMRIQSSQDLTRHWRKHSHEVLAEAFPRVDTGTRTPGRSTYQVVLSSTDDALAAQPASYNPRPAGRSLEPT